MANDFSHSPSCPKSYVFMPPEKREKAKTSHKKEQKYQKYRNTVCMTLETRNYPIEEKTFIHKLFYASTFSVHSIDSTRFGHNNIKLFKLKPQSKQKTCERHKQRNAKLPKAIILFSRCLASSCTWLAMYQLPPLCLHSFNTTPNERQLKLKVVCINYNSISWSSAFYDFALLSRLHPPTFIGIERYQQIDS